MRSNVHRRLEDLEGQVRQLQEVPDARTSDAEIRRRMQEHLARAAELRRGGATPQNNAEFAAMIEAIERRRRGIRGGV